MKENENIGLDFIIDELTNSIKNVVTGDSFQTEIARVTKNDLKTITKRISGYSIGNKNLNTLKEKFIN